jgi:hypothetical protein
MEAPEGCEEIAKKQMCTQVNRNFLLGSLVFSRIEELSVQPWRNHMKFGPELLLWGVVLISAAPVWADRIDLANGSPVMEFSAESTPPLALSDRFELKNLMGARDSKFSVVPDTFFPLTSDVNIHTVSLRDLESDERAPFISDASRASRKEREGNGAIAADKDEIKTKLLSVPVPEPGSLSLLLAGLAVVGISSRRRRELSTTM